MAPGVEVARVDSNTWSLGVRGFESTLSRSVLGLSMAGACTRLCSQAFIASPGHTAEDIDRIEVIEPRRYHLGANASSGNQYHHQKAQETHGTLVSTGGECRSRLCQFPVACWQQQGLHRIYGKGSPEA